MALPTANLAGSYRDGVGDSVSENRLDEALSTLQDFVGNLAPHLKDTVLLLRRRHSQYRSDSRDGVAEKNEADVIARRILEIVAEAEKQPVVGGGGEAGGPGTETAVATSASGRSARRIAGSQFGGFGAGRLPLTNNFATIGLAIAPIGLPESTEAVTCDKITKGFTGTRFQLEELSFSIRTGQITGVVGRNASGKTTLLRILLGEIQPDSGTVSYPALTRDGRQLAAHQAADRIHPSVPRSAGQGGSSPISSFIAAASGGLRKAQSRPPSIGTSSAMV